MLLELTTSVTGENNMVWLILQSSAVNKRSDFKMLIWFDFNQTKGLLAVGYGRYGDEKELVENPIKHLYDVYVKINKVADEDPATSQAIHDEARAYFKRMEQGKNLIFLWRDRLTGVT